jgi:predicted O-methyltransferase YrrM
VLVDLINEHYPASGVVYVEIGLGGGYNSAHLLKYCPQIKQIFGVDLIEGDPEHSHITHLSPVKFLGGYSDEVAKLFEDESIDVVFIDGDHSESWVLRDLSAWVPKVKPGGLIAGHDYDSRNHPGVKLAADAFFEKHPHPLTIEADKVFWTVK